MSTGYRSRWSMALETFADRREVATQSRCKAIGRYDPRPTTLGKWFPGELAVTEVVIARSPFRSGHGGDCGLRSCSLAMFTKGVVANAERLIRAILKSKVEIVALVRILDQVVKS